MPSILVRPVEPEAEQLPVGLQRVGGAAAGRGKWRVRKLAGKETFCGEHNENRVWLGIREGWEIESS